MSELTISGRIVSVLPLQQGTSKAGNPWQKQEYILDTGGQYPKKVCFSLFGDSITKFPLQVGQDVAVSIDIESREYNGKYYTEVRAWHVTYASQQPQLEDKRTYKPKAQAPRTPQPLRGKPAKQQPYQGGDQHQINDRDGKLLTAGENER